MALNKTDYNRKSVADDINSLKLDESSMDDMFNTDSLLDLLDEVSSQEDELKKAVNSNTNSFVVKKAEEKTEKRAEKKEKEEEEWLSSLLDDLDKVEAEEKKKSELFDINNYPREIYSNAQLSEIQKGIDHNVDIRIYADVKYTGRQMREIRYGLERNLDVTHYANVLFRERQMQQIRLGLQQGLDVSSYARLLFSATDMKEKRRALFMKEKFGKLDELSYNYNDIDTGIKIYVEKGLMEAGIIIKKKLPESYTKGDLKKMMDAYDLTFGFAADELPDNLSNLPLNVKIPVLHGRKPVKGKDGYYEFFFVESEKKPEIKEDGSVDYFAPTEYKKINRGDVVAEYHPANPGEKGLTVTGLPLEGLQGKDLEPLDSMDLIQSRDKLKYLSKKEGFMSIKDGKIQIMDFLQFAGDVTHLDGDISFDGNIQVNGNVLSDANISCSGDLFIKGFVENANLTAEGNIIISGGVNADGECSIISGGAITSAFFENAKVESGGNIETGYSLNSEITCRGILKTKGKKSLLCGGRIIAERGIETGTIGSKGKAKTYVEVGAVDDKDTDEYYALYRQKEKLDSDENKTHLVMETLIQKMGALKGRQDPNYIKLQAVMAQIKSQKEDVARQLKELDYRRTKRNDLCIEVFRNLYENTTVCVNGNTLLVREDRKRSTVRTNGRQIEIS